jgi:putative sigma-54 modulation protein
VRVSPGRSYTFEVNLILSGRGVELDEPLRKYATDKLARVERFFDRIIKMEVELRHERNPRVPDSVEITVKTPGDTLRVHGEGADHFAAIDIAADKLEIQVKKFKDKRVDHHNHHNHNQRSQLSTRVADSDEDEDDQRIVRLRPQVNKPITPEEARLELDANDLAFLMFVNAESMQPAVIYRRDAGDYGLIEPEI